MRLLLLALLLFGDGAHAQAPARPSGPMSDPDAWMQRGTVELTLLDKVRAQPSRIQVRVGQSATFGTLTIAVRHCVTRPADLPADNAAFLDVTDSRPNGTTFRGWMLAGAPSLSQLEHPLYDVRVTACR